MAYNLDRPLSLDPLLFPVRVTLVWIHLLDSQRQHGHGQQLEGIFQRRPVDDLRELGVLLATFLVGGALQDA